MNIENLHKLIDKYEENFYELNNVEHNEIFKWRAMKHFRDVWFSPKAKTMKFSKMFNEAKKEFFILMDNSYVSPSNGIVKIAENEDTLGAALAKQKEAANEESFLDDDDDDDDDDILENFSMDFIDLDD